MKEHQVNKLENFIGAWYLEDTKICDDIISYFKVSKHVKNGRVYDADGNMSVDRNIKTSKECRLETCDELLQEYRKHLNTVLKKYVEKYSEAANYGLMGYKEPTNIQYYPPDGGFYKWHTERGAWGYPAIERCLVFMTYLNDVYTDGETEFLYQKTKIKPEKGLTVIWPSDWTHTHRGISTKEHKYIVTGWLHYMNEETQ
jgi:hypothetical protein